MVWIENPLMAFDRAQGQREIPKKVGVKAPGWRDGHEDGASAHLSIECQEL